LDRVEQRQGMATLAIWDFINWMSFIQLSFCFTNINRMTSYPVYIFFSKCKPFGKQNDNRMKPIQFIKSQITNVTVHHPILFKLTN